MVRKEGTRVANKQLTDKHKEMLPYIADGKSDKQISVALKISHPLVNQRIERMIDILRLSERDELVAYAREYVERESNE